MMNMKKFLLPAVLFAVVTAAHALEFKMIESQGIKLITECRFSVAPSTCAVTSTNTVSGVNYYGTSWSVASTTGSADFEVKFASAMGGLVDVYKSSSIRVLAGGSVGDKFESMSINPMILVTRVDNPGTTVYIDIGYLAPRAKGGF